MVQAILHRHVWLALVRMFLCEFGLSGHVKTQTFLDRVPEELRAAVAAGLGFSKTGTMGTMKCSSTKPSTGFQ
jgi:hypothetical protein